MTPIRLATTFILLFTAVAASGCGDNEFPTAVVKGQVTYKSKPVPNGTITFVPENGPAATGNLNPDGTFELTTYKPGDGAVIGKHGVMVVAVQDQAGRLPEDRNPLPPPLVPNKYLSATTSGLTAEVLAGQVNTIDFHLTDDKKK